MNGSQHRHYEIDVQVSVSTDNPWVNSLRQDNATHTMIFSGRRAILWTCSPVNPQFQSESLE
jgi:hypothetical protein